MGRRDLGLWVSSKQCSLVGIDRRAHLVHRHDHAQNAYREPSDEAPSDEHAGIDSSGLNRASDESNDSAQLNSTLNVPTQSQFRMSCGMQTTAERTLRPNQSAVLPARSAPKKAPPAKTETMAPRGPSVGCL